jgi:hypothetical protein
MRKSTHPEIVVRPADRKAFAGSRDFGVEMRKLIKSGLESGVVLVDLGGLEDMTPSFADECFAKLSEERNEDVTGGAVVLQNGDRFRSLINAVTRIRLQRKQSKR